MKITYKQFIKAVKNCVDFDGYFNRDSKELKIIEEVLSVDFNDFGDEELKFYLFGVQDASMAVKESYILFNDYEKEKWYLLGVQDMQDIEKEKYLYFDDDED